MAEAVFECLIKSVSQEEIIAADVETAIQIRLSKDIEKDNGMKRQSFVMAADGSIPRTEYKSVDSNENFVDAPHAISEQSVLKPWSMKGHADLANELIQSSGFDSLKTISPDETSNNDSFTYQRTPETFKTKFSLSLIEKRDPDSQKLLNNESLKELLAAASTIYGHHNSGVMMQSNISDETETEPSTSTPMLTCKEQNKLRLEQLQQRVASVTAPLNSMLGTKIETSGESSTDLDLESVAVVESSEVVPTIILQRASNTLKSIHVNNGILNAPVFGRKLAKDLMSSTISVPSKTAKKETALRKPYDKSSKKEMIKLQNNLRKGQRLESSRFVRVTSCKYMYDLMFGIGKVLRESGGGVPLMINPGLRCSKNRKFSDCTNSLRILLCAKMAAVQTRFPNLEPVYITALF
ncbi:unnamed protein product [Thelazia callipaeda]|uniref:Pecanex-like protein n=1 Tax=Thelazia callipaeda TaxID=103827 RepID=A0A0N5D3C7_THECL|nr:unnamed protein product [Thelazia callipaeda]